MAKMTDELDSEKTSRVTRGKFSNYDRSIKQAEMEKIKGCFEPRRQKLFDMLSLNMKNLFSKCWTAKASKRLAIKAKCYDCCCYQKEEIANCNSTTCPLYEYRPFKK
jgi:hypothetical protein